MRASTTIAITCIWLVLYGCDGSENPPPTRALQTKLPKPKANTVVPIHITPVSEEKRLRIGQKRAIAIRLLDQLDHAELSSAGLEKMPDFLGDSDHAYPNPWQMHSGNINKRLVWSNGERQEWSLRSALAVPSPTRTTWSLTIPPEAELHFGYAVGSISLDGSETQLAVTITDDRDTRTLWSVNVKPERLNRLWHWESIRLKLSRYAGRRVKLTVDVLPLGQDPPVETMAFFTDPVITTTDAVSLSRMARVEAAENVLLVIVDSQRGDTVGPRRNSRGLPRLFPTMESLVDEGANFTQAISVANQTRLSVFSLLTSQSPRVGLFYNEDWDFTAHQRRLFYSNGPPLLTQQLKQMGYRTVQIGNSFFTFGNNDVGLDADFDQIVDHRADVMDTPWITRSAIRWIRDHAKDRWFMLLHYNAPHADYEPPDDMWLPFKSKLSNVKDYSWPYLGEVKYTDNHLAEVLTTLDELGLTESTLVVFTGDHGEVMSWDHQCYNETWDSPCTHRHGKTLYDEELHVPLVFRLPGTIKPSTQRYQVSLLDVAPTILGLIGAVPNRSHLGRNLAGAILGGPPPINVPALSEGRLSTSLRWGQYKYIVHDPRLKVTFKRPTLYDRSKSFEELYSLRDDPGELNNLAWGQEQSILRDMREKLATVQLEYILRSGGWPGQSSNGTIKPQNVVCFHSRKPSRFTGKALTNGRFVSVKLVDGVTLQDSKTLVFDVDVGESPRQFRFLTDPPEAELHFDIFLNDEPVDSSRFYVGAYGLALLQGPIRLQTSDHFSLAVAGSTKTEPSLHSPSGVYYWRTAKNPKSSRSSAKNWAPEVKRMMKKWGYK